MQLYTESAFHWGKKSSKQKALASFSGRAKPESTFFLQSKRSATNWAIQHVAKSKYKTEQNACNKGQRQVNWVMLMARALRTMIPFHSKYLTIAFYFCCSAIVGVFLVNIRHKPTLLVQFTLPLRTKNKNRSQRIFT